MSLPRATKPQSDHQAIASYCSKNITCLFCGVVGCGDHTLEEISLLPDPCPLPNTEKKRSLNEKERLIYAPLSGVGGVVYDKVHVIMKSKKFHLQIIFVYFHHMHTCICVFVSTLARILQVCTLSTSRFVHVVADGCSTMILHILYM